MSSPSSSTATAPSTSPTSTPPPNKRPGLNNSSNLYLVTFLATLFLLLFISCAIVLRSYIMRRRFQRQINEAMAAGIILAPRTQGSRKHRFGTKPKFFTSWVIRGGEKWDEMMPVSALPVVAKRRSRHSTTLSSKPTHQPESQLSSSPDTTILLPSEPIHGRFLRAIRWRDEITHQPSIAAPEKPATHRVDMLQVSVLIAMPSTSGQVQSSRSSLDKLDEEDESDEMPEVVFGVTRLPFKPHNHITTK